MACFQVWEGLGDRTVVTVWKNRTSGHFKDKVETGWTKPGPCFCYRERTSQVVTEMWVPRAWKGLASLEIRKQDKTPPPTPKPKQKDRVMLLRSVANGDLLGCP